MPYICVPSFFVHLFGALRERLKPMTNAALADEIIEFNRQCPHPQPVYEELAELELVPVADGTTHLDAMIRWTVLGWLLDETVGLWSIVANEDDRRITLMYANLHARWLDEDYVSEVEWKESLDSIPKDLESPVAVAAMSLGNSVEMPFGLGMMLDCAAAAWQGRRFKPLRPTPLIPSLGRRIGKGVLNLIVRPFGYRRTAGLEYSEGTYIALASWLVRLCHLRWLSDDAEEAEIFNRLVAGELTAMPKYKQILASKDVPAARIDEISDTLRRMAAIRKQGLAA